MKPSILQVAEAFHEDAIPIVKQEIRKNKSMIRQIEKHYKPYYYDAGFMRDTFSRVFWVEVIERLKPKMPHSNLKRLQTTLFLLQKPTQKGAEGQKAYQDLAVAIERAKNANMLDLYPWERLKKNYTRYVACCPLHGEKTPSFVIYTKNNSWYCFGCHEGGNPIDFIMKLKGCEFKEAVRILS